MFFIIVEFNFRTKINLFSIFAYIITLNEIIR